MLLCYLEEPCTTHVRSYMRAYLSTLDQNTRHECSTIAKLSAGAGVFYHKLERSGKVVHEALIQYTCSATLEQKELASMHALKVCACMHVCVCVCVHVYMCVCASMLRV